MAKPCCANCVYAQRPMSHWLRVLLSHFFPGLLVCFNHAQCPGAMTEVFVQHEACRNFRERRTPGVRQRPPKPADGVCYIPLTQGQVAIVDAEDFEELNQYKWCAVRRGHTFYACRYGKRKAILMHRVIMKAPDGMVVDHIDGNGLNNRKSNLRLCTWEQNNYNSRPRGGSSGFKGVSRVKESGKYRVFVGHMGDRVEIRGFDDPAEAARARDKLAREVQGEYAWLNFPHEKPLEGSIVAHSSAGGILSLVGGARVQISENA